MSIQGPVDLRIDVTGRAGGLSGALEQVITVHLPDPSQLTDPPIVIFGFPGGGVGRGYWCLETADGAEWSQARYHADRGAIFVSVGHLGVGQSTTGNPDDFTMEVVRAGNIAGVPPPALARNAPAENLGIWAAKVAANTDLFKQRMYYLSFFDDSDAGAVRQKFITPAFSRTTPGAAKYMLSRGVVAEEAARIECPVFLGFGERDTSMHPRQEPAGYLRANDIQLAIIPGMAHGQNFNGRRRELWERLHPWVLWVASNVRR